MALLVVRHAHAGRRSDWERADRLRPLSARGEQQARSVAERFGTSGIERILSSPAIRCVGTVSPLAEKLGVRLETDERLFEGSDTADVTALLRDIEASAAMVCSHGDVIPLLLRRLIDDGMEPADGLRWSKASTWEIERTDSGWGVGRYIPAPSL